MSSTIYKSKEETYHPYTREQAEALLPAIGTRLKRTPGHLLNEAHKNSNKRSCVVVEVNPVGLWFRVRFENTGLFECYKVPEV